jgi:eukaryotic-like serine/threonine-protein kinase
VLGKLLDGRYRVIQILSAGGFGETYIAEDTRRPGNPRCVLKLLKPASSDPNYLEVARRLFQTEAEILEQLGNHDQIPRLLAYFEEDREFYLVQELIVGHPLSAELRSSQIWTEPQVIEMLHDVLGILDYVHRYGAIHRDLKPDNLIRREFDRKLVLIDFGAVKQMRSEFIGNPSQISPTVAVGTPGYMPAEQSQGKPRPNSDLYALGAIAIQALTGLFPTQLPEDPQTGEIIWQDRSPVTPGLATILQKLMAYHYRDRYQSAGEVLYDLQQLASLTPPTEVYATPGYAPVPVPTPAPYSPARTYPQTPSSPYPVLTGEREQLPSPGSISLLNKTLTAIKFVPLIGAAGVLLFQGSTWIVLLGVGLAAVGAGLFALRSFYPQIAKDYDAIFAVMFCLCGVLLLFQNQYVKQEIQISQFLLAGAGIFSATECLKLRQRSEL